LRQWQSDLLNRDNAADTFYVEAKLCVGASMGRKKEEEGGEIRDKGERR
jgi:hypothetical protein